ncbi:hypothetical protein BaRGS_00031906 [Batillaria attramentaria]|uniref:Uncharacterized protein n=1 Tax=Batillaria attramentaria TaxID=370345 RepID=A0ABD0JP21_9CAEN
MRSVVNRNYGLGLSCARNIRDSMTPLKTRDTGATRRTNTRENGINNTTRFSVQQTPPQRYFIHGEQIGEIDGS